MMISVIVPVYNTEPYLARCINSILNQSFSDFELLLIDDGSTDGSEVICDTYTAKDKRVRVFHKENGGVSSARNWGLQEAKGEWVCFVDSDDELLPYGLEIMTDGISDSVDLIIGGYEVLDDEEVVVYSIKTHKSECITNALAVKEMYSPTDYQYQGYVWNKMFRTLVIKANSLRFAEDICFNEDRLFVTQFICLSRRDVSYTTIPVYKYFERRGRAMMSIKRGFNPKFVTDMEAQIRMRQIVRESYGDTLSDFADYGVYLSYRRIVGMMKESHYVNGKLKSLLRFQLVNAIGIRLYAKYEIRRNKHRLLNKIKRFS